jgi:Arc/MetJ family transcription regulator
VRNSFSNTAALCQSKNIAREVMHMGVDDIVLTIAQKLLELAIKQETAELAVMDLSAKLTDIFILKDLVAQKVRRNSSEIAHDQSAA